MRVSRAAVPADASRCRHVLSFARSSPDGSRRWPDCEPRTVECRQRNRGYPRETGAVGDALFGDDSETRLSVAARGCRRIRDVSATPAGRPRRLRDCRQRSRALCDVRAVAATPAELSRRSGGVGHASGVVGDAADYRRGSLGCRQPSRRCHDARAVVSSVRASARDALSIARDARASVDRVLASATVLIPYARAGRVHNSDGQLAVVPLNRLLAVINRQSDRRLTLAGRR